MSTTTVPVIGRAARLFHALSDETRLEIVRLLSHGERCVCELQDVLDAAQSRLSFHLKTLKDAGLVTDRKSTRLNSSHGYISYAVFCLKKKKQIQSVAGDTTGERVTTSQVSTDRVPVKV